MSHKTIFIFERVIILILACTLVLPVLMALDLLHQHYGEFETFSHYIEGLNITGQLNVPIPFTLFVMFLLVFHILKGFESVVADYVHSSTTVFFSKIAIYIVYYKLYRYLILYII